jgi:hypothetical protein
MTPKARNDYASDPSVHHIQIEFDLRRWGW